MVRRGIESLYLAEPIVLANIVIGKVCFLASIIDITGEDDFMLQTEAL